MRKALILLIIPLALSGCVSSKKLLEKGQYDKAISVSVKRLNKKPSDKKELDVLKEAYAKANFFDQDRIDYLKKDSSDEDWMEIYNLYSQMDARQREVESLPNSLLSQFKLKNYNDVLISSKNKAADVTYRDGMADLQKNDKLDARKAYDKFIQVQQIYPSYKNVDRMIAKARFEGTSNVLFKIENHSQVILPANFESELKKISLKDLNDLWLNFDTFPDSTIQYAYYVTLDIKEIHVSPESISRTSHSESKQIQDGTQYVLDKNGNVEKDSLGNDIKVPKFVTISANVSDIVQHKRAFIGGTLDYYDLVNNQMIKTQDVAVNSVFFHRSAVASGDSRALADSTKEDIKSRPQRFPSTANMLMNAATILKDRCKSLIYANRYLFR